jgi:transporter family-2 protein
MVKVFLFSSVVFAAGVGIPIMGAINAGLGTRLASPVFATVILMFVGFVLASLYMLLQGIPSLPAELPPIHSFGGGFFVVFYVLAITTIAPKIGLGNAIFLVLIGQIVSTSVIDHYGLFGAIQTPINVQKGVGIAFMAIGIFLARRIV